MAKKIFLITAIGLLLFMSACTQAKQWVEVTVQMTDLPTRTLTLSPTLTQTASDTPTPTPTPTLLPGITPTWFNRYRDSWGATDAQAKVMDAALMRFKEAAVNGDKETMADMIDYPIWVLGQDDWVWVANKQDFINLYDQVFTAHFREVMSHFDFNGDYLFVSYHGFFIMHYDDMSDTEVLFDNSLNGKIVRLIYGEFSPDKVTLEIPSITPTRTFTATPIGGLNAYRSATPTPTPYWFATTQPNLNSIFTYFGTWVITRYESTDKEYCQGDENYASDEVGRKVELLPDSVQFPDEFLMHEKRLQDHIVYQWLDQEDYDYKYGNSLPDSNPDKMKNPLYLGVYIDRMGELMKFEVTQSGRLVINDSCFFFYLDKVSSEQP